MKNDILTYSFLSLKKKLHQSAMGFLRNDEDARDVLQDTFFNLWKTNNIESEAEARNKLFTVLRNLCIDRLRRNKNVSINEISDDIIGIESGYTDNLDDLESHLLRGVTEIQCKIYSLVIHEGKDYKEISSLLNMSVEAVKMNMYRARKQIHENYKKLNQ